MLRTVNYQLVQLVQFSRGDVNGPLDSSHYVECALQHAKG